MKRLLKQLFAGLVMLSSVLLVNMSVAEPQETAESKPIVLSVKMEHGKSVYRLNGKTVEDRRENSLLNNLMQVATERGNKTLVLVIVDERAPFTEAGKLQTALDKIDMPNRKVFIADFADGTMNEIHWDDKAIAIPKS